MANLEEALVQASQDVEASPEAWEPRVRRGSLFVLLHRFEEGVADLRIALRYNPTSEAAHGNLGAALLALGRDEEAAISLERALELHPGLPEAQANLANCRLMQGDRELIRGDALQAAQTYRSALALDTSFARGWERMSAALAELGAMTESLDAIKRAIALDADAASYYRQLGQLDARELAPAMIERLEAIAANPTRHEDRFEAELALYHAYKSTDARRAFNHLLRSGTARRRIEQYNEPEMLTAFDEISATFPREEIAKMSGTGNASHVPVFIIGMPRSGTTLVEQILASHPAVYGAGELASFRELAESIGFRTARQLHALADHYLAILHELAPHAQRVTNKMPFNFLYAGIIAMALPHAHIIHIRRNPLDTAFSCFEQSFEKGNVSWSYDLGEIGRYMRGYQRLMEHWRATLPEGLMLEVQYEDLVSDFEPQARRIVEFCGLPWNEQCLEFYKTARPVRTSSVTQVRKPLYASSIGRAERYREFMQPFLDALNA